MITQERKSVNTENLSTSQLNMLIQKGKLVETCKKEWKRRWGMDYPMYKSATGIKSYI